MILDSGQIGSYFKYDPNTKNNADDHIKFTDYLEGNSNDYKDDVIFFTSTLPQKFFIRNCLYKFRGITEHVVSEV